MISVYDIGNENYDKNGDVVLTPISGSINQVAGGSYDLTMVHPIDEKGKWTHLVPDAVIRAPIPEETITNAYTGLEADVYKTTEDAALREGPSEPETITYSSWSIAADYSVGAKVTFYHQNYKCIKWDDDDYLHKHVAPSGSSWWRKIANKTAGSPVLINLKSGTELYYVSGPEDGWYYMSTVYGMEGYIRADQVVFDRHLTPEETQPRTINTQLFRITTVTVDTKEMRVTVNANHVSLDLNGVLIESAKIVRKPAAQAIAWIEQAFMIDYRGTIASNITSDNDTDYSCDISGKSGMFALVDPDQGVVPTFDAEFRRDNWDLFVMAKTNTDRGFRIVYGKNMLGVNWKISADKVITRVVPVAKDAEGNELYLDPVKWVDSEHISGYPVIRMERLKVQGQVGKDDGSETATNWTAETLRGEMQKQAEARFSVDKVDELQHEITVDFEMMGDTEEYRGLAALQHVLLYDLVKVENEVIGLGATVTVTELEYDIVKEKVTALKLTNVNPYNVRNVSGFNVLANTITGNKLTDDAGNNIRDEAVDIAVDESNEYTDTKCEKTYSRSTTYTDEYVGSKHGYSSFEAYIKYWVDHH